MDSTRLVIDLGSSSKKYALFAGQRELARCRVERSGDEELEVTLERDAVTSQKQWPNNDYRSALWRFASWCVAEKLIESTGQIVSATIRIVAPGKRFALHQIVTPSFIDDLRHVRWAAPLHIDAVLAELELLATCLGELPVLAASDSAFHATMPERARRYALPRALTEGLGLQRTGYHGLSLSSIVRQLSVGQPMPKRAVVCHLGAGVSVTALFDGKSVDTSMGMTPLEGAVMSTRVGDIDPGILLMLLGEGANSRGHLGGERPVSSEVKERITDVSELSKILTERSGLLALSGSSADMKTLLEKRREGDEAAALAIDIFCYKIRKYIGSYAVALGGLDALILTGTIAERSDEIVSEITEPLTWLGATVQVIPTDELAEMARIEL